MRKSEQLCQTLFEKLNPENHYLVEILDQSHGEHDFNILNSKGQCVGVLEATSAVHEHSKKSQARFEKQGPIKSDQLKQGWLLMAHNPDPKWCRSEGVKCISVLEKYNVKKFSSNNDYHRIPEVASAVILLNKNHIENGGVFGEKGSFSFLISCGENNESYILSEQSVVSLVRSALCKPDNTLPVVHIN